MAHQESLIQWASSNRDRISLAAKEFDWAWKNGLPLYDFEIRLEVDGFQGAGRGSDEDETTALTKAIAEALERVVCASLKISSVGVAAHTVRAHAKTNAQHEILERHVFEWHLKNHVQFAPLDEADAAFALPEMRFFRMRLPKPHHAVLCFHTEAGEKFVGLSCDTDLSVAMNRAALEVLRNVSAFQSAPVAFRQAVAEDPNLWCCQNEFLTSIEDLLGEVTNATSSVDSSPILHTEKIETSHLPTLAGCPVGFERARILEVGV